MNGTLSKRSEGSTTSLTLLQRAKQHDEGAWDQIVQLYGPLVYRLCRLHKIQGDDAQDIVQDVFRAVFGNIARFRRDRPSDSFRAWLVTITRNKIRDYFRKCATRPPAVGGTDMQMQIQQLPDLDWDDSTDESSFDSSSNMLQRIIQLVRGDFEERTWDAFWKTTIEGRSPIEVAEELGVTKWTVYQAKSRVLRRLREDLGGLVDELP